MQFLSRRLRACVVTIALAAAPATALHANASDTVLIVVSSEGRDQGKTRPGFEMDEFAQAYLIFRDNGLAIDVASPAGGAVQADKFNAEEPFNAALMADAAATGKLAASRATRDLRAKDYAAVYVVGGKGAMFDLPEDTALRALLGHVYDNGGIVAAVCHGPAALVDVTLANGAPLVAGRQLTGFSNEEEAIFGKRWASQFRFLLEDAMRERGAHWQEAPLMMPKLVVDGRLITGQNPYSTTAVAEAIVRGLGRTPVARTPWRDEATMTLVQRLLDGEQDAAHAQLAASTETFHVELIGLLGYYQLKSITDTADTAAIRNALSIMQLAQPHMPQPQLSVGIAEAHWRLGDTARARAMLDEILEITPGMEEATDLLARMTE